MPREIGLVCTTIHVDAEVGWLTRDCEGSQTDVVTQQALSSLSLLAVLYGLNLPVLISTGGLKLLRQTLSCAAMLNAYLSPHGRLLSMYEVFVVLYSEGGVTLPTCSVRRT